MNSLLTMLLDFGIVKFVVRFFGYKSNIKNREDNFFLNSPLQKSEGTGASFLY